MGLLPSSALMSAGPATLRRSGPPALSSLLYPFPLLIVFLPSLPPSFLFYFMFYFFDSLGIETDIHLPTLFSFPQMCRRKTKVNCLSPQSARGGLNRQALYPLLAAFLAVASTCQVFFTAGVSLCTGSRLVAKRPFFLQESLSMKLI